MRQQKDEKDTLAAKMQLYQKWKADYQRHQEAAKKEQAYLKAKKQEIDKLWGEISAIYMRRLSDALNCEPEQLMDRLQGLLVSESTTDMAELPVTVTGSEDTPNQEVDIDGT